MRIEGQIASSVIALVKELYRRDIPMSVVRLQKTKSSFEGNLTLVVFPFLKISRQKPEDTAQVIGELLTRDCSAIAGFNVMKGFLNLSIAKEAWVGLLNDIHADEKFGEKPVTDQPPLVMIEYSSPNTNKPLHLGHVCNNLLGWSLAQIMQVNGNRVVGTNIVNNRGIHICGSTLTWLEWGNGETPESGGKKGDRLISDYYVTLGKYYRAEVAELKNKFMTDEGLDEETAENKAKEEAPLMKEACQMLMKQEQDDEEVRALWQKMNSWVYIGFDETYRALGVSFDRICYESDTYLEGKVKVEKGLKKDLFFRKDDNSVWADLTQEGLGQKLLLRSDGTSMYIAQDIGTADIRFKDFPIDEMIYVVGSEQNCHFQVLSILLDRSGFKWSKELIHFSYSMIELPNGKMKSREDTVVDVDELITTMMDSACKTNDELGKFKDMNEEEKHEIARMVGLGVLKYSILRVNARESMSFNPEESIDSSDSTGSLIQYTCARIRSIMRRTATEDVALSTQLPTGAPLNDKEIALIQKMSDFGAVIEQAATDYSPSGIANYCYELAKDFNQFYHDYGILNADTQKRKLTRLVLANNVAKIIRNSMLLLGIEAPERM